MKQYVTIAACVLLFGYGLKITNANSVPQNTIAAAQSPPIAAALHPIEIHDTILVTPSDTVRDTVSVVKYKTKYKMKRVPCTHNDSIVSIIASNSREVRKETPPDTIPSVPRWYKVYGTVQPISETR